VSTRLADKIFLLKSVAVSFNMPETKIEPKKLVLFGRSFFLLFNRSNMYEANHPYCIQAVNEFLPVVQDILKVHSPLVFIMNQEKFFVDDEPLDPRINTSKMVSHFKKAGIQSISFHQGLDKKETSAFVGIFTALNKYPNADIIKKEMAARGLNNVRINHVFFKKVSTDEEIISRDTLKRISLNVDDDGQTMSRTRFMDMVLESVLMEEFEKTLTIKNITEHPETVSENMIAADLEAVKQSDAQDKQPGLVLVHQLQMMEGVVSKHLCGLDRDSTRTRAQGPLSCAGTGIGDSFGEGEGGGTGGGLGKGIGGGAEMTEIAAAVFSMKRQLINGIELQKSLGITYPNEQQILDKADEITDNVLIALIKDEYQSGRITVPRLAHIMKRLIPDSNELKRLLPKIKQALLEEGMPLSDYLNLVQALCNELQDEELSKILQKSAEEVGLDGADLIGQVKNNPVQVAELIFLAAEIQKGTGDDHILTDLLVNYVERIGTKLSHDIIKADPAAGEQHLRKVMNQIESQIINRLKSRDAKNDILEKLEQGINKRIDEIFEKLKKEWAESLRDRHPEQKVSTGNVTVLEVLEQGSGENEELKDILRVVRQKIQSSNLDENDFKSLLDEITTQTAAKQNQKASKLKLAGILDLSGFMFFLEKEIARASRYDLPFATLSLSVISATPIGKSPGGPITPQELIDAVLQKLAVEVRDADVAAFLEKNKLVALLPMTSEVEAKQALRRHLRLLNTQPVEVHGIPLSLRVAGVATNFNKDRMPNAKIFYATLISDLTEMVNRIKTIHGLA
jgi:hypothetical protein